MKKYQVWSEGYRVTGNSGPAIFHGDFSGETFRDAVSTFKDSLTDDYSKSCVDLDQMTFWGCKFFDNLSDASKFNVW